MPSVDRPLRVFLCHAHADRNPVRGLYARLTQDGVDAWLDKEKLLPGQDWEYEIRKSVREADVVVVCLSKQFNQAGFRQKEVRLALDTAMEQPEGEIFIIPARLEECETLESLRKWQWVDLFENDGYDYLFRSLHIRAEKVGATLKIKRETNLPRFRDVLGLFSMSSRTQKIQHYLDEIDDFRDWQEQIAALKIRGNIVRLNNLGITKINLHNCYLAHVRLESVKLLGSEIWKANLEGCDLENSNLQGSDFWSSNLSGALLRNANLSNANFDNALLL